VTPGSAGTGLLCPSCRAQLPRGARFCPSCGERIGGASGKQALPERGLELRKTVTVIFCDLVGSTELSQRLDPEPLRALMLRYFALMNECVAQHGGVVEKYIGDAVMAVFGVPAVHEDDALRAVRAADQMRDALVEFNREVAADLGVGLNMRIGVNTGPVVAAIDPGATAVIISGETVNLAARLEQHAGAGEILLGPLTCEAVKDMAEFELLDSMAMKGIAQPVAPGRLIAIGDVAPTAGRRFDLALVDRRAEMAMLRGEFGHAVSVRGCRVLTVHGDPGIGKSRLAAEFAAWARDGGAIVAEGRCLGYGAGGSLLALAEAVRQLLAGWSRPASSDDDVREALAVLEGGLLADDSPGIVPGETIWALGRVLTEIGRDRPLVLILDDMHWADPALLTAITSLAGRLSGVAVMMLCLVRSEFVAEHDGWADALPNAGSALIGPLHEDDCHLIVAQLDEVVAHQAELAVSVVSRAEGNPLYLEQLMTVIAGNPAAGVLPARGAATADPARAIPVGINGLIAYRLDLLTPDEREVIGLAAVAGRDFTTADLAAAAEDAPGGRLDGVLAGLARRRLIRQPGDGSPAVYRFESALVYEVAYNSLPKGWRAGCHERLASWLAASDAAPEVVGTHWERAWLLRRELGTAAAAGHLADRAVDALRAAAARALASGDPRHAIDLLDRALPLCPDHDPRVPVLKLSAGEARLMVGEVDAGRVLLEHARDEARAKGTDVVAAHASLQLAYLANNGQFTASLRAARRALPVFEAVGDHLGVVRAWLRIGVVEQSRGRHGSAARAFDLALERVAGLDAELEHATVLGSLAVSLWLGPQPVAQATGACRLLLREHAAGHRTVRAALISPLAMLVGMGGQHDEAGALLDEAEHIVGGLDNARASAVLPIFTAAARLLAGDLGAAEGMLRRASAACRRIRDPQLIDTASRDLARVRLLQGGDREAAQLAEAVVPDDMPGAIADRSGVQARLAARMGDEERARGLSSVALAAARRTDSPVTHATALLDAAVTLRELGDLAGSSQMARRAAQSFSRKGHLVGQSWVSEQLKGASP
jgi:class 3 adenylate cyclase/tetratricopeptide (TPR) repeat protein